MLGLYRVHECAARDEFTVCCASGPVKIRKYQCHTWANITPCLHIFPGKTTELWFTFLRSRTCNCVAYFKKLSSSLFFFLYRVFTYFLWMRNSHIFKLKKLEIGGSAPFMVLDCVLSTRALLYFFSWITCSFQEHSGHMGSLLYCYVGAYVGRIKRSHY